MVSHHTVARETTEAGLTHVIGVLALFVPAAGLALVMTNTGDYRLPAVAIGAWLGVLAAAAWLVPRLRRGGLTPGETAAALSIAVAAVSVIGAARRPHGAAGSVDLAVLGVSWLLILIVLSRPAWVWIPAAALVFAAHSTVIIAEGGVNTLSLSQLAGGGYILTATMIAFSALRPNLATRASMAARQAVLASRSAAERAGVTAIQQERQYRLAVLEKEALPLLRGIADGTLDPASDDVRQQCARHAAILRDSLTGRAPGAGELMAALEPALRAARERGLLVREQVIGDPGMPPIGAVRAVLARLDAVISELPAQQVILTVLVSGDDVELYLTTEAGEVCLEDSWRKGGGT